MAAIGDYSGPKNPLAKSDKFPEGREVGFRYESSHGQLQTNEGLLSKLGKQLTVFVTRTVQNMSMGWVVDCVKLENLLTQFWLILMPCPLDQGVFHLVVKMLNLA